MSKRLQDKASQNQAWQQPSLRGCFLGRQSYGLAHEKMREFTDTRSVDTQDQLWLLEHPAVFTQGQAGKPEHILQPTSIPLVQSDRGGQVTYHGPGQLIVYPLVDLRRLALNVREFVTQLEQSVIQLLATYGVSANARSDAPGVYVEGRKIASLGLRVRRGCSFHGVAININMDLQPFDYINPCGYRGMTMVQLADLTSQPVTAAGVAVQYAPLLAACLGFRLDMLSKMPAWAVSDSNR